MAGEEAEAKVVRGASLLILLQVVSRAITFIANQVLLRFLTAQLLGISTQLEVYYLSVLFFARESLRVAIQRQGSIRPTSDTPKPNSTSNSTPSSPKQQSQQQEQEQGTQAVVNLSYLSIGLGILVAALLGSLYLRSVPAATLIETPYLMPSVYVYAAASVLELLSEPAFVVTQIRLQFAARARAEGLATFAKCVVTLAAAVWAARRGVALGVLPFALGQVAFGLALLGSYTVQQYLAKDSGGFSLLPRPLRGSGKASQQTEDDDASSYVLSYFYRPTLTLASSMMIQSFVKHLLTQGDTFLVSVLSTPTAQGVYALANNYGGLAARLVFQPIEESSRSYFSRLLSSTSSTSANGSTGTTTQEPGPCEKPHSDDDQAPPQQAPQSFPPPGALAQASENLTSLLRIYTLISLPLLALGPTAAPLVLSLVAGPQWTSSGAGTALAAYVYYIPFLAINGLTEAFVASVATEAQVHRQSAWMTAFSLVFAAAGYIFMRVLDWGAVGLVWANGINMGCRIVWAVWFIRGYFANATARTAGSNKQAGTGAAVAASVWDPAQVLPSPMAVAAAAVASQVVRRVVTGPGGHHAEANVLAGGIKAVLIELVKIASVAVPFVGVL